MLLDYGIQPNERLNLAEQYNLSLNDLGLENIRAIDAKSAELTDAQIKTLAKRLETDEGKSVLIFNLKQVFVKDVDSLQALASMLEKNNSLKKLRFPEIESPLKSDKAALIIFSQALATALAVNRSLEALNLYGLALDDDCITIIASALSKNNTLKFLGLGHNQIGPKGAAALAGALSQNHALQVLHMMYNPLGDDGFKALMQLARENTTLMHIMVSYSGITSEGVAGVLDLLKKQNRIHSLSKLFFISFDESDTRCLSEIQGKNTSFNPISQALTWGLDYWNRPHKASLSELLKRRWSKNTIDDLLADETKEFFYINFEKYLHRSEDLALIEFMQKNFKSSLRDYFSSLSSKTSDSYITLENSTAVIAAMLIFFEERVPVLKEHTSLGLSYKN